MEAGKNREIADYQPISSRNAIFTVEITLFQLRTGPKRQSYEIYRTKEKIEISMKLYLKKHSVCQIFDLCNGKLSATDFKNIEQTDG